ncbi:Uncharacterised protein [Mycobacteroides abscessus subsp. abscessus]|nr:Uncharacterised protein [Mycobacteroides abscessus subsp. abscessus]
MWLDQLLIDIKEQEMIFYESKWDYERYERLNSEYLTHGREYLLNKYKQNLTYVYKYLNSSAYKDAIESYNFVKEKYDHMQRSLYLIQMFHPDADLINPGYYTSEETIAWKGKI